MFNYTAHLALQQAKATIADGSCLFMWPTEGKIVEVTHESASGLRYPGLQAI